MKFEKITKRIKNEFNEIEMLTNRINTGLKKAKQSADDYYIDGVALNLHGLYSAIERIFALIAENIDDRVPEGKNWHAKLTEQMSTEIINVRPAIISKELEK